MKGIAGLAPVRSAQLMTYLHLSGCQLGLLNVLTRIVRREQDPAPQT